MQLLIWYVLKMNIKKKEINKKKAPSNFQRGDIHFNFENDTIVNVKFTNLTLFSNFHFNGNKLVVFPAIHLNVNDTIAGNNALVVVGERARINFITNASIEHRWNVLKNGQISGDFLNFTKPIKIQSNGDEVFLAKEVHLQVSVFLFKKKKIKK